MKKILLFALSIIIALSLFGCGSKSENMSQGAAPNTGKAAETRAGSGGGYSMDSSAEKPAAAPQVQYSETTSKVVTDTNRKIIYNASVSLDVKDVNKTYDTIDAKAKEIGGYTASSNINKENSQITVRVPAVKLDEFLKFLDTLGGENKQSNINTDDVTDQYTDTESRIRNLKAEEAQLLEIMKKAATVDETLKVQSELYRVRGEIESLQGRVNMWDKLVEMSTVSINLSKIKEIGGKDVSITFISWNEIVKGMSNGLNATVNFIVRFFSGVLILLVSILPFLPFIAVGLWFLIRYLKRSKKKNIGQ